MCVRDASNMWAIQLLNAIKSIGIQCVYQCCRYIHAMQLIVMILILLLFFAVACVRKINCINAIHPFEITRFYYLFARYNFYRCDHFCLYFLWSFFSILNYKNSSSQRKRLNVLEIAAVILISFVLFVKLKTNLNGILLLSAW